jgi:hypothetical protein
MANSSAILDWCNVRLGEDHNWWADEVSDPVRWDTDGLSIIDPRQAAHLIDLVEPLRDYGFDQDLFESAFIPFRIEKEVAAGRIRLKRVKDSIFDSDEKLFALADVVDDENGPYADLLDHLTKCRVKLLNDVFKFEAKLTVDEVEDELREDQNASFIEGKPVHSFDELCAILDYTPAGFDEDAEEGEAPAAGEEEEIDDADLPDLDEEGEEALKGDQSLKWDEDEAEGAETDETKKAKTDGDDDDEDEDSDDEDSEDDDEDEDEDDEDEDGKPRAKSKTKSKPAAKKAAKPAAKPAPKKAAKPAPKPAAKGKKH